MAGNRFLFVTQDAGGTVPPVIAVARAILDAGGEVTILGQPSVRARAEQIGATFQPFADIPDWGRSTALEEQLDVGLPLICGADVGRDLTRVAHDVRADLLVVDPNIAGALAAAEVLPIPSAVLLHCLYKNFVDVWFGELWPVLSTPVNQTRAAYGLEPAASWSDLLRAHDLVLAPIPTTFDAAVADPPPQLRHFGFLVPTAPREVNDAFPPGDGQRVLVSLSTTHQAQETQLQAILQALSGLPVRALVATSGHGDASGLVAAENTRVVTSVPHAAVLADVDVVVTHAGLGTTAAALAYGAPLVCQPLGRDQMLNAERVGAVGAGLTIEADASTETIASAVQEVLAEERFRDAARAIAVESRNHGESTAAAGALLQLAR